MESTNLSPEIQAEIETLFAAQNSYAPNPDIIAALHDMTVIIIVGAVCAGKSYAMRAAALLDPRFGVTGCFTSRQPRTDDKGVNYTYIEHSNSGLALVFQQIRNHEVVQYAFNPINKAVYGSTLSDYSAVFNMTDVWASAVAGVRKLGFGTVKVISIVTPPELWLQRFQTRFPEASGLRTSRLLEAAQSFTWSLSQADSDSHFWVINDEGTNAAEAIIAITLGTSQGDPAARALCEQNLLATRELEP